MSLLKPTDPKKPESGLSILQLLGILALLGIGLALLFGHLAG
jgi:hypothetical protein